VAVLLGLLMYALAAQEVGRWGLSRVPRTACTCLHVAAQSVAGPAPSPAALCLHATPGGPLLPFPMSLTAR
jgi:hypothetical protein